MKLNVMLIDDSTLEMFVNLKSIEKEVKEVEVLTFIRAKMALEYLNSLDIYSPSDKPFIPHIILVDIRMPEMDGYGFLNAYRQLGNANLKKSIIYMLTDSMDHEDIMVTEGQSPCDGFISKPLTTERVKQLVLEAMARFN